MPMICSCMLIATQFLVRNCWSLIRQLIDVLLFGKSDLKMPVFMWSASIMQWCSQDVFFTKALAEFQYVNCELHDSVNLGCQESRMLC